MIKSFLYSHYQVQPPVPSKKLISEIPTPQYLVVDTYERDYSRTFNQPASYLRARGGKPLIPEMLFNICYLFNMGNENLFCSSG